MIVAAEGQKGRGTHASLSRFDTQASLVAAGPDFKAGFVNEMPSGNIDIVPTVLAVLGVTPPTTLDGRVLQEAMTSRPEQPQTQPRERVLEASSSIGFHIWSQYLKLIEFGSATYYVEGNGEARVKSWELRDFRSTLTSN